MSEGKREREIFVKDRNRTRVRAETGPSGDDGQGEEVFVAGRSLLVVLLEEVDVAHVVARSALELLREGRHRL